MARYHAENGGWLTEEDLAEFQVGIEEPLRVRFGELDVYTCGPWCQGPLLAQSLRLLDGIDLKVLGHNSAEYIHTIVEVFKLAYADRHAYVGDPNFVDVPIEGMLNEFYLNKRRELIDPDLATPGMPAPGYPEGATRRGVGAPTPATSTRGAQSSTDPASPAVLAPGKRPRLTPNPAIAMRGANWVMPFGSPGNDVQPQAMVQVLLNLMQFGMDPQQAIEEPRFATFSYPRSSDPHSYSPGLLNLEGRYPEATLDRLRVLGHDVQLWPDWEYKAGAVCAIVHDRERGTMEGGSDPRRPTAVVGL